MEDLGTISRMLELPNGRDIATAMLSELSPCLSELRALRERDPTGGVRLILDYAEGLRTRLRGPEPKTTPPSLTERVA